jgi:hypothetical protein
MGDCARLCLQHYSRAHRENTYYKPEVAIAALHFTVSLLHYHVQVDNSFSSFALQGQGLQQSAEEAPRPSCSSRLRSGLLLLLMRVQHSLCSRGWSRRFRLQTHCSISPAKPFID